MKIRKLKHYRPTREFRTAVFGIPLADVDGWLKFLGRKVRIVGEAGKSFLKKIGLFGE